MTRLGACAQVLASIGQLEFFYDQAPDVMRSCSMALQLLSVCIGSYLSGALVAAISSASYALGTNWLPQDLNYGRLDLFFLLLAGARVAPGLLYDQRCGTADVWHCTADACGLHRRSCML